MPPLSDTATPRFCAICGETARPAEVDRIRSNVRRFRERRFEIWRCPACQSLHCEPVADLAAYYQGYPIRAQRLDYFSRAWYAVVLRRLVQAGFTRQHRLLDHGCNQGLFLAYLKEQGYTQCTGYDPFVERFHDAAVLQQRYDVVVSLDVIEHDTDPADHLGRMVALLQPAGLLCIETPNASGIDLRQPETYLHALHLPYHQHILSWQGLQQLAQGNGLQQVRAWDRWYMDAWQPATSRRLIEGLLLHGDNDIDAGYEPPRLGLFLRHPSLLFHLLFGYFVPGRKNDHMMMMFRPVQDHG
ncbi:MAG TPA: class I SAM-dependent methyltransferase [Aquabacterium sp.]|nr:class I SAM-dependent methyltransferase [Aquabacterium sp.]HQC94441.1 class I SAM-dependent methyltransferase [Aquabacterium sp.]